MHLRGRRLVQAAVPREYPFETVVQQAGHRFSLSAPGVPARVSEGRERVPLRRPGQVIACEQDLIPVQENLMPLRMTRRRKTHQAGLQRNGAFALGDTLDAQTCSSVSFVHDPGTSEVGGKLRMVGNVVSMRQEHLTDTPQGFDLSDERPGKAGRVNENVAPIRGAAHDEVRPGAKIRFGRKPAEVHVGRDVLGKRPPARLRGRSVATAYRWTRWDRPREP